MRRLLYLWPLLAAYGCGTPGGGTGSSASSVPAVELSEGLRAAGAAWGPWRRASAARIVATVRAGPRGLPKLTATAYTRAGARSADSATVLMAALGPGESGEVEVWVGEDIGRVVLSTP